MKTLIIFLALLSSLWLMVGVQAEPTAKPTTLRVLSYNIKHGRGEDNTFDYKRLAKVITSTQPDLVALQEVDVKTGRSRRVDQPQRLGELTKMSHHFAEAMPFDGGSYGEAVLSRWPIAPDTAGRVGLTADKGQEPRSIALIDIKPQDGPAIVFGGTHLCHQSGKTRLSQAKQINKAMIKDPDRPTILAGDFNFTPGSDPYNAMIEAGWVDTAKAFGDPKPTYPSDRPRKRIDYVFVRPAKAWRVVKVQVLDEPVASDHAPVLVVLEAVKP